MNTCKRCGGVIRTTGAYWDVLPTCGCGSLADAMPPIGVWHHANTTTPIEVQKEQAEIDRLRAENEAHRAAQARIFQALGPNANPDRDTWPAQIEALRAAQVPRPMATAPRDGTEIRIYTNGWLPLPPAPTTTEVK
jgi:hypothetical protein